MWQTSPVFSYVYLLCVVLAASACVVCVWCVPGIRLAASPLSVPLALGLLSCALLFAVPPPLIIAFVVRLEFPATLWVPSLARLCPLAEIITIQYRCTRYLVLQ